MNWKQLRVRQREKAQIKSFASNEHYVVQEPSIMWSINLVPVESIVVAQPCVLNWRVLRFDEHYSLRLCVLAKHCSPSTMCTCWALLSFDQFFVCMFCIFSFFLFLRLNRRWFSRSQFRDNTSEKIKTKKLVKGLRWSPRTHSRRATMLSKHTWSKDYNAHRTRILVN